MFAILSWTETSFQNFFNIRFTKQDFFWQLDKWQNSITLVVVEQYYFVCKTYIY